MKNFLQMLALVAALSLTHNLHAEDGEKEEEAEKTIADLTEDHSRVDGLITVFQDDKSGSIKLLLDKDLLGDELVYFAQTADGVVQTGYFRGAYLANEVISFRRHFNQIEVVAHNTNFYFDPDSALSRASKANISDAVLAMESILAEDEETGQVLIAGDDLFKTEAMLQIKPSPNPDADPKAFSLGGLSDSKTRLLNLRSYPQNTDFEVEYVYNNPAPTGSTGADITDDRNVAVRVLHSIIAMPDNDYEPRFDDPRVGYFTDNVTNLTSLSVTPYRDLIARWHLQKKDPSQAVSDPVEPITFWIENTTPVEYRDMIRDAALEWNNSFEKAGFSNAVAVKVQPDDADWDAGDIRYNVLRWTSSPNPPFGGYGPSFVNPRTGQIMGADIMFEFSFLGRYNYQRHLMSNGASLLDSGLPTAMRGTHFCTLADGLRMENGSARALLAAAGEMSGALDEQITNDSMYYLVLHEIGHTLGLNHNMKATQLLSREQAFDPGVAVTILAGSVMDYPAVNFAPAGEQQTLFYTVSPGPYDDWAIRFGYAPEMSDAAIREAHLARSTEPALAFGNDADDMRSPGKAIDPLVNIYDMSSDAIGYASERMDLIGTAFGNLPKKLPEDGKSYQQTHDAFAMLMGGWARSAAVVSRFIGGVHVDRAMIGQPGAGKPYTAVDADTQRRAMRVLADQVFAPDVAAPAEDAFRLLAQQRRGFGFFAATEDPKIHDALLSVQGSVLDHVMHPAVMKRLTDSAMYGNGYSLADAVSDLTGAIFDADARGSVNSVRQNLQVDYVTRLAAIAAGSAGHDNASRSMAVYSLQQIERMVDRKRAPDVSTKAHVAHLKLLIERALSTQT